MPRTPTTQGARRTRDRVLSAALELFNERGSASVTTNHVAASAGISPGNLYYWFSDKEEIVRELYGQYVAAYEQLWGAGHESVQAAGRESGQAAGYDSGQAAGRDDGRSRGEPLDLTPDEVLARLCGGAALSGHYAFLARELLALLHADSVLAAEYGVVRQRRIAEFTHLAGVWRELGVIRPLDEGAIADLVQALWIVAETWLAFAELDGRDSDAEHGTRLLRIVLLPYLTQQG